jgi:hypothetical protein
MSRLAEQNGGSARDYPVGFATLAARLWASAIGPTRIFMQRRPRDERPHLPPGAWY